MLEINLLPKIAKQKSAKKILILIGVLVLNSLFIYKMMTTSKIVSKMPVNTHPSTTNTCIKKIKINGSIAYQNKFYLVVKKSPNQFVWLTQGAKICGFNVLVVARRRIIVGKGSEVFVIH